MTEQQEKDYYADHTLSVSSVRLFAQNPARALADWNGEYPWFDGDGNALELGRAFHQMMEDMLTFVKEHADDADADTLRQQAYDTAEKSLGDELKKDKQYQPLLTKAGALRADTKRLFVWVKALWFSTAVDPLIDFAMVHDEKMRLFIEKPFKSTYQDVTYKGKLDAFTLDAHKGVIDAYDYKTSKPFPISGKDWGTDVFGHRRYMPVEWTVEKLFPWQAGVYRQLLRDNGCEKYTIRYHYLVVSKQDVPRIDVFEITPESMDLGFEQFAEWLVKADRYIAGVEEAPLVMDDSNFVHEKTQKNPIMHETDFNEGKNAEVESEKATGPDLIANFKAKQKTAS